LPQIVQEADRLEEQARMAEAQKRTDRYLAVGGVLVGIAGLVFALAF